MAYASYGYNADEQMTSRSTSAIGGPTGTVHYVYDLDGHLIAEADGATGITLRDYIWLPANDNRNADPAGALGQGLNLAANNNAPPDLPLAVAEGTNLYTIHADHLGRPIRMTDQAKSTVWAATWKPWGEPHAISGTIPNNIRFPGQYFQLETGLHYNWHRTYDPVTGRYTQPDPLRFVDGPSIYAYAGNSPYMFTDREGRRGNIIGGLTGAAAGVAMTWWLAGDKACFSDYLYFGAWGFALGAKSGSIIDGAVRSGKEFKVGKNWRIARFGNRTGNSNGEKPHYHRRGSGEGQGIGRHRPWDKKSSDRSFWDRF